MTVPGRSTRESWFREHYEDAASQILEFLSEDGLSLEGRMVADIGCGDGALTLGLAHKGKPKQINAYDIRPVDKEALEQRAQAHGPSDSIPENILFIVSEGEFIPAQSDVFDAVVSWSAFEHVAQPAALLREIHRVLNPATGFLFLQIWPLFYSEHGGHLWVHGNSGFDHLTTESADIHRMLEGAEGTYPGISAQDEWRSLNRLTLDGLQRALLAAQLVPVKVELLTPRVHLSPDLMRYALTDLTVAGVKLIAVPADPGTA